MKKRDLNKISGGMNINTNSVNISTPVLGFIDQHKEVTNDITQELDILNYSSGGQNHYKIDSKGDYILN